MPLSAALSAGTYYLVVKTDAGGVINESNLTTEINSAAIALSMPPPPDLSVSSVASLLTTAQPGQSETVSWTVQNGGGSPASGTWTDNVYLSPDGLLADATLLGSVSHSGGLTSSAFYTGTLTVTLSSTLADGSYQVIVVADAGDAVATDPNRANNQQTRPKPLGFGHVDLVPAIIAAPATATSGDTLTVSWTTMNSGTAAALNNWVDRVYLSPTAQVTAASLLLGQVSASARCAGTERHRLGQRHHPAGRQRHVPDRRRVRRHCRSLSSPAARPTASPNRSPSPWPRTPTWRSRTSWPRPRRSATRPIRPSRGR